MSFVATWMDQEIVILSELSQREKNKYPITYMWNLKKCYKRTFLQNKNPATDEENKLMITGRRGRGGGINWETGVDIYILQYIK